MAAESNASFHQDTLGAGLHRHGISFQSGAVNSTSEMIPIGNYYGMNGNSGNLMFCDNSSIMNSSSPSTTPVGSSSGSLLLDSVPGLKHDAGLAVEWTEEEQCKLLEGLVKYKDEPSIMKYIKIAALLREKTVRDVALRCRWMTRKRRKQDELYMGRKGNYRKDKLVESSSKTSSPSTSIPNMNMCQMASYSHQPNQMDQNQRVNCQVLTSKAKLILEQNVQALNQINNNISVLKLQDNIDLFCRTRDNINNVNAILNDMREFSGKLGQMQELPISIDQNLADNILPRTNSVAFHVLTIFVLIYVFHTTELQIYTQFLKDKQIERKKFIMRFMISSLFVYCRPFILSLQLLPTLFKVIILIFHLFLTPTSYIYVSASPSMSFSFKPRV